MNLEELERTAKALAKDVIAPRAEQTDREARWPEEILRALLDAGLGGLVVPSSAGGLGHGLSGLALVCEVVGEACASTGLCYGMHCVGAAVLAARATPSQTERYLRPIAEGRHLTTLAVSEPGTGVHFYLPQAKLERTPDGYRVTGVKTFVTNGGHADSYVISTAPVSPEEAGRFSCAVLSSSSPGFRIEGSWDGVGMRGNSARTLVMESAQVPREDLLGEEGDEIWYVFNVIAPYFLVAMAATYLGVAKASLNEVIAHLARRAHAHSGRRLAEQPVVQHRLGELWAEVERTRQLIREAARLGDAGHADALLALCSAKAEVAHCAVHVANEAMTLAGGQAYRENASLHRHLRDARAAHVMSPTTDLLRTWTGRALLGLPILGD